MRLLVFYVFNFWYQIWFLFGFIISFYRQKVSKIAIIKAPSHYQPWIIRRKSHQPDGHVYPTTQQKTSSRQLIPTLTTILSPFIPGPASVFCFLSFCILFYLNLSWNMCSIIGCRPVEIYAPPTMTTTICQKVLLLRKGEMGTDKQFRNGISPA